MSTWFVSRHLGAIAWVKTQQITIDRWCEHLDVNQVQRDDVVIGTLPIHLAAQVCERGAIFYFVSLNLPAHLRGKELTPEQMCEAECTLQRYVVTGG